MTIKLQVGKRYFDMSDRVVEIMGQGTIDEDQEIKIFFGDNHRWYYEKGDAWEEKDHLVEEVTLPWPLEEGYYWMKQVHAKEAEVVKVFEENSVTYVQRFYRTQPLILVQSMTNRPGRHPNSHVAYSELLEMIT